jgi:hypothetical protein
MNLFNCIKKIKKITLMQLIQIHGLSHLMTEFLRTFKVLVLNHLVQDK